jgi:glutaredoxin
LTNIEIIGTKNCSKCIMVKKILDKKNIEYSYCNIEDLSLQEQEEKKEIAKKEGVLTFPLIFKNGKIVQLEEILNVL